MPWPSPSLCSSGAGCGGAWAWFWPFLSPPRQKSKRSEEHTSELQSLRHLVCRLLLEKKKKILEVGVVAFCIRTLRCHLLSNRGEVGRAWYKSGVRCVGVEHGELDTKGALEDRDKWCG